MVGYDFDSFEKAKRDLNNATTSLSLLTSLKDKFQRCEIPKILNTNVHLNICTSCKELIDSCDYLKVNFENLENAIKDMGLLEQEYIDAMAELSSVKDEIWDFTTTPVSGRVTLEQGQQMHNNMSYLNERKEKLEDKTERLKGLLGITTEEDKKWYESFAESMDDWYDDRKKLTDSYKNIFTNETSGGLISNIGDYFETLSEVNEKQKSTNKQMQSNIYRGIGNLLERAGDFATQILGWLTASAYKNPQSHMSPYMIYMQENNFPGAQVEVIQDVTKSIVTKNTVDDWYTSYYKNNEVGKDINAHSYVKYDSEFAEAVNQATQSVGETAAILALSTISGPGGALLAAGFEGSVKGGDAANYAYENGATFDEATLYSSMIAGVYGSVTYVGSNYFNNITNKTGAFMPTFTTKDAIKVATLSSAAMRTFINASAAASVPIVESVAEWLTWGSDKHIINEYLITGYNDINDNDLIDIFTKNQTGGKALSSWALGLGLSTVGEVMGSLQQGKVFREKIMREYGLSPAEMDDLIDRIHYVDGKNYVATHGSDSAGLHYGDPGGGDMYLRLSPFSSPDFDKQAVYHEAMHDIGELKLYHSRALNETTTELLASRLTGSEPMSYNPKAIAILDKIEETIDPTKSILKDLYSVSRNYVPTEFTELGIPKGLWGYQSDKFAEKIMKIVGDEDIAYDYIIDIKNALQDAVYGDAKTKIIGENELQTILDNLTLWRPYD